MSEYRLEISKTLYIIFLGKASSYIFVNEISFPLKAGPRLKYYLTVFQPSFSYKLKLFLIGNNKIFEVLALMQSHMKMYK